MLNNHKEIEINYCTRINFLVRLVFYNEKSLGKFTLTACVAPCC